MKNSDNMSRILCKGAKEDGSPCQPNGLSQFDGCCIAHDPADKTLQQRSRGGNTAAVSAQQNKYGIESLIVQGLATLRPKQTQDAAEPALTDVGRRRPGLQRLTSYTPEGIDRTKDLLSCPSIHRHDGPPRSVPYPRCAHPSKKLWKTSHAISRRTRRLDQPHPQRIARRCKDRPRARPAPRQIQIDHKNLGKSARAGRTAYPYI